MATIDADMKVGGVTETILRFGRARYNLGVDIINVTNSDATLTYNQNYNPNPATPRNDGWRRRRS